MCVTRLNRIKELKSREPDLTAPCRQDSVEKCVVLLTYKVVDSNNIT